MAEPRDANSHPVAPDRPVPDGFKRVQVFLHFHNDTTVGFIELLACNRCGSSVVEEEALVTKHRDWHV